MKHSKQLQVFLVFSLFFFFFIESYSVIYTSRTFLSSFSTKGGKCVYLYAAPSVKRGLANFAFITMEGCSFLSFFL